MTNVSRKAKVLCHQLKNQFVQLNLFDSDRCRSDPFYLRTAIISTRIYIILLILIVTTLIVSSVLGDRTESRTIRKPSQATYEDLFHKYPTTLTCRCGQTAIPFGAFISVSTQYHPICSSVFVSDHWISLVFRPDIAYYFQLDFRSIASGHFQLLSSLCSLAQRTVRDALDDFLSSTLLSINVLSSESLEIQSQIRSMFVWTSSADAVRRLVDLIRNTTHTNGLQSALQTTGLNMLYVYPDGQLATSTTYSRFTQIDGTLCWCLEYYCVSPSSFYDLYAHETDGIYASPNLSIANVSGFMSGCYAMESLSQSTLECLFDQECLNTLLRFLPTTNISAADVLLVNQTKFSPKTRIGTLVSELFLEQWITLNSFSTYYNHCAPIACTYTFERGNSIVYDLTVLIGLYGGLTVILRLCVPHVIHWWRHRANRSIITQAHAPLTARFQAASRRINVKIVHLNLYTTNHNDTDPYDLTTAIIATRIYLLFLGFSITTLIIFTSLQIEIHSITVDNPSREVFEHLHNKYATALYCPCSQTAIHYGSFISLSPKYHPVCSSPYISTEWIISVVGTINDNFSYEHEEFHIIGRAFFSTLSVLCSTAQSTLSDAWFIFNYSTLITDHVLSPSELIIRLNTTLEQFEFNTINEFKRLLSLIRLHTKTMFSAKRSNVDLYTRQLFDDIIQKGERIEFHSVTTRYDNCLCGLTDECQKQIPMYTNGINAEYTMKFLLPNFFTGCFATQSVLQSSLECFFNQTCLDAVQAEIISEYSINTSILDVNATRFSPETLISTLMNSLMIEDWGRSIHYDRYYEECAPRLCSYTIYYRKNALYIITKLISLLGGLTVGLKIVVFIIVKWIRKRMRSTVENNHLRARRSLKDRTRAGWFWCKTKVWQLNLFTKRVTVDTHRQYAGIIATRLYFLFLTLSMTILIIYTSTEMYVQCATVDNPSQAMFVSLQSNRRYASTLECPCRDISIPFNTFIDVAPQFHQLCSSDFAIQSARWMSIVYDPTASLKYPHDDFRLFIVPEFHSLFALCTLANETLRDALTLFMSNTFVSTQVQTRETIEKHAGESLVRFRSSTPRTFVRMLDYVRLIAQGNGIVSSISSNWHFVSLNTTGKGHSLWGEPRSYNNGKCSCGINASCTSPAYIGEWRVPGFRVGCYPLEALLQSTLECLYDAVCIDRLKTMYYIINITTRPLDPRLSFPNTTVQSLVNELLVARWTSGVIYERYYAACNPRSCSYSIIERANILYIINTILGLYGGLCIVLKLIIPAIVSIGQHIIMRRRRTIQPTISVIAIPD